MSSRLSPASPALLRDDLQAKIHLMQGKRGSERPLPVLPSLSRLLPGGLRPGAAYSIQGSMSLAMALLAGPSLNGSWCGVAGLPDFGVEAAVGFGIALDRLVLVPDPGASWSPVIAAMADVLSVVLARAPERVAPAEAARLGARLRERSAVLLVLGPWPQSEAVLQVNGYEWSGLGQGHGHLSKQELELEVALRGSSRRASVDLADSGPVNLSRHRMGA
ncbi:hypothetical protein [Arthrobacter sp. NA-172]|uniref:hypothetical protein n=1 Tax=Arthrobacter sp. NA-172 TaxID=3367524 RepID=UPI0037550149